MTTNAFLTGNSCGLGKGLTEVLLEQGYQVYGCSRRGCDLQGVIGDIRCDLSDFAGIAPALNTLLADVQSLDLVVLNAGILGRLQDIGETSLDELKRIMDINVWSNKIIFDWLLHSNIRIEQILLISSGAAVLGNKGWGGYALSKATLNMLGKLYAHEFPRSHIMSIAPGLIETEMMESLCNDADSKRFPALRRIQQARGTEKMLSPRQAAEQILSVLPALKEYPSGSFIDLREILAPEDYAELMKISVRKIRR
ncbi:SDR family NAD(P)-dependent oxidoreductase [Methylomarinum vadi]|uniref:SDR family NAD(P)-dependent oxidoreductase n=1 Tax=Methylomarinum vadi TaxID=438855 RepID=UPI0004DF9889|nr:SDR family NAD(P)-dependent oxidoreductase [Methylomarinum vadi]